MLKKILFVVSALAIARAQVPSLGWCPEYVPMANFDMSKFLGVWYEAERYFQITEVVSRCVMANYTKGPDGKLRVSNEVTNRLTGIKRVLEGEIKASSSKADEGKLHVKYTVPFTPETQYAVLDTDYKSYAVLWSCSGIGPINAQNAWLMTRERQAPGEILQKAYGVLDKYKISKTFFVKTDQEDCAYLASKPSKPSKPSTEKPSEEKPTEATDAPAIEEASEPAEDAQKAKSVVNFRSAIVPDAPAIIIETRKAELAAAEVTKLAEAQPSIMEASVAEAPVQPEGQAEGQPSKTAPEEPIPEVPKVEAVEAEAPLKSAVPASEVVPPVEAEVPAPSSVPEVILKTADLAKELEKQSESGTKQSPALAVIANAFAKPQQLGQQIQAALADQGEKFQAALADQGEKIQAAFADPAGQLQAAFSKPIAQVQEALADPAGQLQAAFAKPIATVQEALAKPLANIQQALGKPTKAPEAEEATEASKPEASEAPEAPEKVEEAAEAPEKVEEAAEALGTLKAIEAPEEAKEKIEAPAEAEAEIPEKIIEASAPQEKQETLKIES